MTDRHTVFLSASVPTEGREPFFSAFQQRSAYYRRNIRESVLALVGVCYESGFDLVFGGHPAITPLVHQASQSLKARPAESGPERDSWRITVFQSDYFAPSFPPEIREFQEHNSGFFESVKAVPGYPPLVPGSGIPDPEARDANLNALRHAMIDLRRPRYLAGVFIGGMDGVLDEFDRFRKYHPQALLLPITSTGGATATGWPDRGIPPLLRQVMNSEAASRQPEQMELLLRDQEQPGFVTCRTLFRRLLPETRTNSDSRQPHEC